MIYETKYSFITKTRFKLIMFTFSRSIFRNVHFSTLSRTYVYISSLEDKLNDDYLVIKNREQKQHQDFCKLFTYMTTSAVTFFCKLEAPILLPEPCHQIG